MRLISWASLPLSERLPVAVNYKEVRFDLQGFPEYIAELLPVYLGPLGFDSFQEDAEALKAYIPDPQFDREALERCLQENGLDGMGFTEILVPGKNWNEEWEKHYEPVIIDARCLIRAPFHTPDPKYPLELVIEPKMSFGTGHHETTSLMAGEMLETDFSGCTVLDAGCGTGILAILAEKLGASAVLAADNDPWCIENASENVERNQCSRITLRLAETSLDFAMEFDRILANINLNVLTGALGDFTGQLKPGGILLMSGIFGTDIPTLQRQAESLGLTFSGSRMKQNWAVVRFIKKG